MFSSYDALFIAALLGGMIGSAITMALFLHFFPVEG